MKTKFRDLSNVFILLEIGYWLQVINNSAADTLYPIR